MKTEKLHIHGGEKTIKKDFPWPVFDGREIKGLENVLKSGIWGAPDCDGLVQKFEKEFTNYCDAEFALSTVSGSVALRIALIASGVKPGDEVIVPPYTFIATATIVLESNCVPVFVDIDPATYNLDPHKIEEAITEKRQVNSFSRCSCSI